MLVLPTNAMDMSSFLLDAAKILQLRHVLQLRHEIISYDSDKTRAPKCKADLHNSNDTYFEEFHKNLVPYLMNF
jgi:hypothetical protein